MADNSFKIEKSLSLKPLATPPNNPINGDMYYDSTIPALRCYFNGVWVNIDDAGITLVGTLDSEPKTTDAGFVDHGLLHFQTADDTYPGVVSVGIQDFAGAKTFIDSVTFDSPVTFAGMQLDDGTQLAPSLSFTNSPSTGLYSPAVDRLAISADDTTVLTALSTGVTVAGVLNTDSLVSVGTISGTTITGTSLSTGTGTISGGAITGTSLNLGIGGDITCDNITCDQIDTTNNNILMGTGNLSSGSLNVSTEFSVASTGLTTMGSPTAAGAVINFGGASNTDKGLHIISNEGNASGGGASIGGSLYLDSTNTAGSTAWDFVQARNSSGKVFNVNGSGAITGASLSVGTGSIGGGAITGTSLSAGTGSITGGTTNVGAITGTSLNLGAGGDIICDDVTGDVITADVAFRSDPASAASTAYGFKGLEGGLYFDTHPSISSNDGTLAVLYGNSNAVFYRGIKTSGNDINSEGGNLILGTGDITCDNITCDQISTTNNDIIMGTGNLTCTNGTFAGQLKVTDDNGGVFWGTNDGKLFYNQVTNAFSFHLANASRYVIEEILIRPTASGKDLGANAADFEWDVVYANSVVNVSDLKRKENVSPSILGLDFVNALNPVSYTMKDTTGDEGVMIQHTRPHYGLIAQEVKTVIDGLGIDFGAYVSADPNDPEAAVGLRYTEFIAPLIKAVHELTARIEALENP